MEPDIRESNSTELVPLSRETERTVSMLAHLLSFLAAYVALGFIAPLGVLLIYGERSAVARGHAIESLNFQLTALLVGVTGFLLGLVTFGLGFIVVVPALVLYAGFYVVMVVLASVKASRGEFYRYPLTVRWVKP